MNPTSGTTARDERLINLMILTMFVAFLLFGLFGLYIFTLRPAWQTINSLDWLKIPCEVVSSKVIVHQRSDGNMYSASLTYKYFIDGQTHEGHQFSFDDSTSSSRLGSDLIVNQHPPGLRGFCYVDPDCPTTSVMSRSPGDSALWGLLTLPFILIGGGGCYLFMHYRKSLNT